MKDYSFGNYICALRMGLGLSQFQLGTLVGVSDKAVSKWENGDAKPRLSTCRRLAKVLGVDVNELLSCEQYVTIPARKELDKMNQELWLQAYERLKIYGEVPPAACWSRLSSEEAALRGTDAVQGFAVLGKIAEEAKRHNSAIIVGGALNSSFAAWLFGATEVNPLPPHYRCPQCGKTEFVADAADGFDLPLKKCACGADLIRDGHDIPWEGYAKQEQGATYVELRVSEKFKPLAVRVLKAFYGGKAELLPVIMSEKGSNWSFERYVVMPAYKDSPKLAADGFWHVDAETYWQWQERELTFSFICSAQLSGLQALAETTKTALPDPLSLINPQMIAALYAQRQEKLAFITKVTDGKEDCDFDLLLRLDGLSHATGAWEENGEELVADGIAAFREVPAYREDIFNAIENKLRHCGARDNGLALQVMEQARKAKFFKGGVPQDMEKLLLSLGLPEWYPGYLAKVQYLFPKGHGVAYLLVELICQWYHINYPAAFAECMK